MDVGDWTNALHDELERGDTLRPVWIQGPFSSPYKIGKFVIREMEKID